MKITLDLTALVAEGKLTPQEAERLRALASQDTGSLGINIIIGFGMVAVVAGALVLFPDPLTAIVLGGILFAVGAALMLGRFATWTMLARICITVGTLMICGGLSFYTGRSAVAIGVMSLGVGAVAVFARSGLLAALSVIGLGLAVASGYGELRDFWGVAVPRPTVSIAVFAVLAVGLLFASTRLPAGYERLAIIAARTSALIVNLWFLMASIFGDDQLGIPGSAFAVVWAILLIGAAAWGVRVDRRWITNTAAVFGAVHFLVQWFAYLGANPLSVLGGGILLVAFGMGLWSFNRRRRDGQPPAGAARVAA